MKVLCTNGVKAVTVALFAQAQRTAGLAIESVYGSTNLLLDKINGGETGDLAILSAEAIDGLIGKGVLASGSRVDIARSSIGVAVRRGTAAPEIGTVEALTNALLQAKSVLYSKTGISGAYMPELFGKLGIADRIAPKSVLPSDGSVGEALARGEAELALQQISELLPVSGVEVVGPLPDAVQRVTVFSAGTFASTAEKHAVNMLVAELTAGATRALYAARGLEPAF